MESSLCISLIRHAVCLRGRASGGCSCLHDNSFHLWYNTPWLVHGLQLAAGSSEQFRYGGRPSPVGIAELLLGAFGSPPASFVSLLLRLHLLAEAQEQWIPVLLQRLSCRQVLGELQEA